MIELIAIDLDGTLMNSQHQLSEANAEAIRIAQDKGIHVVICTGRPFTSTKPVLDLLDVGEEDYSVMFNGGQIRQGPEGRLVENYDLSMEDFHAWFQATQDLDLPLSVIDSEWVYDATERKVSHPSIYASKVTSAPSKLADYSNFPPEQRFNKFVVAIDEAEFLDQQIAQLSSELKANYQLVKSYPFQLEVSRKGVSKGQALIEIGQRLGIDPAHMLVIGDQNNDRAMMEVAGYRAAVGNAIDEIKGLADYIGPTNNDDGVADIIYNYIK